MEGYKSVITDRGGVTISRIGTLATNSITSENSTNISVQPLITKPIMPSTLSQA
jgi:hypothetical protein